MNNEYQNTNRILLRLEERLLELGYCPFYQNQYLYSKQFNVCDIIAGLANDKKKCWLKLSNFRDIENQKDMEELEKVFNIKRQDEEKLKNYEK